jgi:hypothetical protein
MTTSEATLLLAFVLGLFVPFQFAMKRIRGFGRHFVAKLPYKPPEGEPKRSDTGADEKR